MATSYEVTRGGLVTWGGEEIVLRAGSVIDSSRFDVADLRRQGCVLRELLVLPPPKEARFYAVPKATSWRAGTAAGPSAIDGVIPEEGSEQLPR